MDFFKACTTNVYLIDNLQHTRYRSYRLKTEPAEETETWSLLQSSLTRLRELNVLCVEELPGICVFDDFNEDVEEVLDVFDKIEEDTLEAKDKDSQRELFLDAIESALAFNLAKAPYFLHLAPWTWICYSSAENEMETARGSVVRLHRKFTPAGALYLVPEIQEMEWAPVNSTNTPAGTKVILAPYGNLATTLSTSKKDTSYGPEWKSAVTAGMRAQGLPQDDQVEWIYVQLATDGGQSVSFLWPEALCVCSSANQPDIAIFDHDQDWQYWFEHESQHTMFRNPLAEAEEWFKNANSLNDRDAEPVQSDGLAMPPAAGGLTTQNADSITSPPFNQRLMDQQNAMAGIYPTPPDGLTQVGSNGQLNTAATPLMTQGDLGTTNTDLLESSEDLSFSGYDHKPSMGADSYHMSGEDLFGDDAGEMDMGNDAVDDADFNFFDDDDEAPTNLPQNDVDMMDHSIQNNDQSAINDEVDEISRFDDEQNKPSKAISRAEHEPQVNAEPPLYRDVLPNESAVSENIEATELPNDKKPSYPEKPLSPFGIRERLLPPPVPASMAQNGLREESEHRRSSLFGPIVFRDNLELGPKYADATAPKGDRNPSSDGPDIGLPQSRKRSRSFKKENQVPETPYGDGSTDDSSESSYSDSDEELPPRTPWDMPDSRKRKRLLEQDTTSPLPDTAEQMVPDAEPDSSLQHQMSGHDVLDTLTKLRKACNLLDITTFPRPRRPRPHEGLTRVNMSRAQNPLDLPAEDFIYVAQIISEQAATAIDLADFQNSSTAITTAEESSDSASATRKVVINALEDVFPEFDTCDLTTLALTREAVQPMRSMSNSGKGPQPPPRPPQRADSATAGPEIFTLPAPYVKIQRGKDNWEMLPTCLSFWETLGLAPTSGPKHIRAFCIFPDNNDLQPLLERFMVDMSTAYEGCKLGTHVHHRNTSARDALDNFEDGMAPVELSDEMSVNVAFKSYANTCTTLGKTLSSISHRESDRSIVVYLINPFRGHQAIQQLCACFWMLWKAYRESMPKANRTQPTSDVVLQLLPIEFLASRDRLVVQDAKQMAILARELYDRCPPSSTAQAAEDTSALHILAAPSVELAGAAPKRIGFQLSAEPPSDLLHEGSILHLAYALSQDSEWMTAAWIDTTGRYQDSISLCLRGRSFAEAAEDVWERTRDIMAARKVTWRIFISTNQHLDRSVSRCWRSLCGKPRAQAQCVTLVTVQVDPVLQLLSPTDLGGTDFLTPASTPQGNNNLTSSPDVIQTPGANPPLTPAPSETAASLAESDPDAHLVDVTDETFALLYHTKLVDLAHNAGVANGALFQRGDAEPAPDTHLPSLGVSVHWTIQVKPDGKWDEGTPKQAELTLREVLRMYRHLSLLTKARGLARNEKEIVPVHIEVARRGVEGLEGMLSTLS